MGISTAVAKTPNPDGKESWIKVGGTWPIPVLGHDPRTDVDTTTGDKLGTIAAAGNATFPTNGSFSAQGIYEFEFFDGASAASSADPPNVYWRPDATTPDATLDMAFQASSKRPLQVKLLPGQTKVSFLNASATQSVTIYVRRLI